MELVDSHTHLDFPQFAGDREEAIKRAWEAGVRLIVNVGTDIESSRASIALAEKHPFIYAAVGIHPHDARLLDDDALEELKELACHPKVVAIGEIGLDYYRNLSPRKVQQRAFRAQLELAQEMRKPVIIHSRNAQKDTMEIVREFAARVNSPGHPIGVMHCFSGSLEVALEAVKLGFMISVAGPLTFKNARKLPQIVREIPLDYLLIETDCPYLAPHPHRGKRNEPAYVRLVAEALAAVKQMDVTEVARQTLENALLLFGIDPVTLQFSPST
ncbi:MAG: hydrolase TatD [Chloroflexi bacterium]|nr:MAG: hydrolase TatD [Chloroflexota bacterium]HDN80959.1 TatD family deoxyribonuclease [Chloroflexota bacterium]